MAKTNNSLIEPVKAIYSNKYISTNYSYKTLIYTSCLFLISIGLLSGFKAIMIQESFSTNFMSVLIGLPIMMLITYSIFHVFISAMENHKKTYPKSFLVFSSYVLPIIAIGHLLNLVQVSTYNQNINVLIGGIVILLFMYIIVLVIRNSKKYFSTTYAKTITSLILTASVISIISIMTYLMILIQTIQGI